MSHISGPNLYGQCIVLATRPILMCLLRERLDLRSQRSSETQSREISEPIKALLRTSADSAHKTLRILAALQSQDLLGMLLGT